MLRKGSRHDGFFLLLSVAVMTLAGSSWSKATADVSRHRYSDEQIRTMITHELERHDIEGVTTSVVGGVVTLKGTVASAWDRDEAMEIVSDLDDVYEIMSEIKVKGGVSDDALRDAVARQVGRYVFYTVFDEVEADVHDGVVSLSGRVTEPFKVGEIARQVSRVAGVRAVENHLRVLPVSTADDHLRSELAASIYRELPELAEQPAPPIHIVVENGDVTLEGAVRSEVEKKRVEHIARSALGAFAVDNRLRVDGQLAQGVPSSGRAG